MSEPPITRSQWVQQRLRRAIITGELRPGQRLITTALADQWSISQTPLREALRILSTEGLVDMSPQKTARVAPVSYRGFAELFEIRLLLEPLALERSLKNRNKQWDEKMQKSLENMLDVVEGDDTDPLVFESAHHDFHLALLSECGSVELLKMIDSLFSQSVRMRLLSASQRGGLSKAVIDEHVNLLELCSGTDIDKSIAGYHSHITRTLTLVLRNADPKEIQFSDLTLVKSYIASLNNDKAALG